MTILAGITRVIFTVAITDDDVQENDETFRLSIRNNLSNDFTFSNRVAMVIITNDDIDGMQVFNIQYIAYLIYSCIHVVQLSNYKAVAT